MLAAWDKLMRKPPVIDQDESLPTSPYHEMRLKWAHQSGVDSGWICAIGEVIGVILAGGGRSGVGRAVHSERCVQLRPAARQEPIFVRGAAEGGGGGGGGLGGACPVRNRPGNRIAASRTGVCRHEKLHEEKRGHRWSFAVSALLYLDVITLKLPSLEFRTEQELQCLFLSVYIRSVKVKQAIIF